MTALTTKGNETVRGPLAALLSVGDLEEILKVARLGPLRRRALHRESHAASRGCPRRWAIAGERHFVAPMQYRYDCEREKICPFEGVSDVRKISPGPAPTLLSAITFNVGPGSMTLVSPASL